MGPVRRAFVILLIAAAVVALGLLFAQDQDTLRPRSELAAEDPRFPAIWRRWSAPTSRAATRSRCSPTATRSSRRCWRPSRTAKRRISFETYIYETGRSPSSSRGARAGRAAWGPRAARRRRGRRQPMEKDHLVRLESGGLHVVQFNAPRWYSLEEVNYRTHRKILVVDGEVGVHRRRGRRRPLDRARAGPDHWRDTQVRMTGPHRAAARGRLLRELHRGARPVVPDLDDRGTARTRKARAHRPQLAYRRQQRSEAAVPADDCRRAQHTWTSRRHFVTDESTDWALQDAVKRGVKSASSWRETSPTRCR